MQAAMKISHKAETPHQIPTAIFVDSWCKLVIFPASLTHTPVMNPANQLPSRIFQSKTLGRLTGRIFSNAAVIRGGKPLFILALIAKIFCSPSIPQIIGDPLGSLIGIPQGIVRCSLFLTKLTTIFNKI